MSRRSLNRRLQRAEVRCSIETVELRCSHATSRCCSARKCAALLRLEGEWIIHAEGCRGCSARKCAALLRPALAVSMIYSTGHPLQRAEVRCSIETLQPPLGGPPRDRPLQRAEVRCSIETRCSRRRHLDHNICCSARKCAALLRHPRRYWRWRNFR